MTLMLLLSLNVLFGQNNVNFPLRGGTDSLVVVDINLIKEANIKLVERNYYKNLSAVQEELIFDYVNLIEQKNEQIKGISVINYQLQKDNQDIKDINESLEKKLNNSKTLNYILTGTTATAIVITILSIIIK